MLTVHTIDIIWQPSERTIKRNTKVKREMRVIEKGVAKGWLTADEAKPMLEKLQAKLEVGHNE